MIELSTIRDLVAIFGVIAGFTYYVLTVRNAQKSRQREQVFLRFQSFDMPYMRAVEDLMNQDWTGTYEDYMNHSPESKANYNFLSTRYQQVGIMLKENMMDPDLLYQIFNPRFIMRFWEKIEKNIRSHREGNNHPTHLAAFEYLYNETKKRYPDIITR
jgi:hypothetical protein